MCVRRLQIILLLLLAVSGCALGPARPATQQPGPIQFASYYPEAQKTYPETQKTIYVVGHGWHTGLVLRSRDVSPQVLPGVAHLSDTDFVEFGWGDEGFYRAKKITIPLVLRAAFWPTPSVLHVAGFRGPVQRFYRTSEIVEIKLTDDQFRNMCQFVSDTLARDKAGASIPLGPGIYGESTFYRAQGSYYFPKTCNVWTAKALQQAGLPVSPHLVLTADHLLSQTREFGHVLQHSPSDLKEAALRGNR